MTTDLVQTRDVHEAGVVDQGAARDVHGHGGSCGAAGGGRQQVFQYSEISAVINPMNKLSTITGSTRTLTTRWNTQPVRLRTRRKLSNTSRRRAGENWRERTKK